MAQRMEMRQPLTRQQRCAILRQLVHADLLERFLAERFPTQKVQLAAQHSRYICLDPIKA